MIVKVKRQRSPDSAPYWQSFSYEGPLHATVSAVLDAINYTDDLFDIEGNPAKRILWECSCMQAVCGGCAMVINGVPALACNTFVDEVKGTSLVLEPLSKFPVVADLVVDRSSIYENLNRAKAYIESFAKNNKKHHRQQYSVAKCLKCGLCLEVCPNYHLGGTFFGAVFANESYLITSQSAEKPARLVKEYRAHFGAGCSKALSCQTVCPAGIETISSILDMNRK
ncbi:MAG: 2Fe-2S iron-sulfur cluster-binding protein [Christensenellales bacterium]|nr:2Fe-2S iron-sulfur cluster-binding protein [Christensenellales bacterium]